MLYRKRKQYLQDGFAKRLVCRVQIDEDVNGSNHHFCENENDDDPLEKFSLIRD
jgi:hypothetical protein